MCECDREREVGRKEDGKGNVCVRFKENEKIKVLRKRRERVSGR